MNLTKDQMCDADRLIATMRCTGIPRGRQLFDPRSEGHLHGDILLYVMPDRSAVAVAKNPFDPCGMQIFRHDGPDVSGVRQKLAAAPTKRALKDCGFERIC